MRHELRYRGQLLGFHASREAAEAHAKEHHGWGRAEGAPRPDHHIEDIHELTIEEARPVHLYCRGNLVDTYLTAQGAHAAKAKLAAEGDADAWGIVDTRTEDVAQALAELYPAPEAEPQQHTQWRTNPATGELVPHEPSTTA